MMKSIVCFGEFMIELRADEDFLGPATLSIAGDTLNTAIYAARVGGSALKVAFSSAVGVDAPSQSGMEFIEREGIDSSLVSRDKKRTIGLYGSMTDRDGERHFVYWRSQSAARHFLRHGLEKHLNALPPFDAIFYSAITLALMSPNGRSAFFDFLDVSRRNGCLVVFDSNYRPPLWKSLAEARSSISAAWRRCDIALPSADDETRLFGETDDAAIIDRLTNAGVTRGVLKRGARGPLIIDEPDATLVCPGASKIVDTSAAGDSFNGAFLARLLSGDGQRDAAEVGHSLATRVIQHRGAIITREQMSEFLAD
ncbi:MAG: sugar kinase [Pseudomonadota bacterium]